MNRREQAILVFLAVVLASGVVVNTVRNRREQARLGVIRLEHVADSVEFEESVSEPSALIDLNTATAAELDLLPGIGPALAQRILDYRLVHGRFRTIDELQQVSGIGPRKLAAIRDRIRVSADSAGD